MLYSRQKCVLFSFASKAGSTHSFPDCFWLYSAVRIATEWKWVLLGIFFFKQLFLEHDHCKILHAVMGLSTHYQLSALLALKVFKRRHLSYRDRSCTCRKIHQEQQLMQLQEAVISTLVQELGEIHTCFLGKLIHNTVRPLNNAHFETRCNLLS